MHSINQLEESSSFTFPRYVTDWGSLKLQKQVCQNCYQGITTIFSKVSIPLEKYAIKARTFTVVDLCFVSSMKVTNEIAILMFKKSLFSPELLKTRAQKKHELALIQLKQKAGEETPYTRFSEATANYLNELIPRKLGDTLMILPGTAETWILFKLGYPFRYINYQANKHSNYREVFISSVMGESIQQKYSEWRVKCAHAVASKNNINMFLDFEHVFLHLCDKIKQGSQNNNEQTTKLIVRSLASSFAQQKEIDEYLKNFNFTSEKEELIARLEWYKNKQFFPKSFPDPHLIRLTPENLEEELDKSLTLYIEEKMKIF